MEEEEYIAGKHAVLEALQAGRTIHKIWVAENSQKQMSTLISEAKQHGIIVQAADKRKLDGMAAGIAHQGVVAQVAAYAYVEVGDILQRAYDSNSQPFLLLLDEIEDPHNLGSILRTAECAGVHGVIIPKRRSAGITATVAKTSAGAAEYVPVARVTNIAQTIVELQKQGIWVMGADASAQQQIYAVDCNLPLALVIGNESKGIGRLIKEKCDFIVNLPMFGQINSLNASVAAGILMYEVLRQRLASLK
ncbi:MAG: 23S rRNA (guanosine(2251)-2'-O)-methyltransferase RlmB [Paenibacillus sp. RIFOXYA1_FULL_44_5]|nr:MAG: 23S rRNA (guanosine(2251)-2'-O)-methyltransferase RlmB [Paenibacillus sp. RIFOXYA1_FULL_44_5]